VVTAVGDGVAAAAAGGVAGLQPGPVPVVLDAVASGHTLPH